MMGNLKHIAPNVIFNYKRYWKYNKEISPRKQVILRVSAHIKNIIDNASNINLSFIQPRVKAEKRIGPHNQEIISIIVGSLLGDATLYNVKGKCRLRLEQKNQDYIYFLYKIFKKSGYAHRAPIRNLRKNGNSTYYFYTYTYTSFISLWNEFYKENKKVVPKNIKSYLTPLALAIWIMDDGAVQKHGIILSTQSFTYQENLNLCEILYDLYKLNCKIYKAGISKKEGIPLYRIKIAHSSMKNLTKIVKPYMCLSMMYKLK